MDEKVRRESNNNRGGGVNGQKRRGSINFYQFYENTIQKCSSYSVVKNNFILTLFQLMYVRRGLHKSVAFWINVAYESVGYSQDQQLEYFLRVVFYKKNTLWGAVGLAASTLLFQINSLKSRVLRRERGLSVTTESFYPETDCTEAPGVTSRYLFLSCSIHLEKMQFFTVIQIF